MSFLGIVLKTKSETVKVHLDIDESQEVEKAYPYHWVPTTGSIMYLMPKVGTRVSLYFPDEHEGNARLTSCVRTNGGMDEKNTTMTHYENRQLLTEHNKNMYLYPEEMGFIRTGSDTTSLTIVENDLMGILFQSHNLLFIEAIKTISMDANTIFIGAKKELVTQKGITRFETEEEVQSKKRLSQITNSVTSTLSMGFFPEHQTPEDSQLMVDVDLALTMESSSGQRIFYAAPLHEYVGYYYDAYSMFVDTPIQQEYDMEQLVQNVTIAEGVALTTGAVVGAIVGYIASGANPAGAVTGMKATAMGATPVILAMAASDLSNGTVTSLENYIIEAVQASVIALITAGIDAGIAKVITQVSKPFFHFLATTGGGFVSGTTVDALSQFMRNGEIDWGQAMLSGAYGAAFAATYWGVKHGIMGEPINTKAAASDNKAESLKTMEDYAKNGVDYEDALRKSQWDNAPSASEYLANQSYWDSAIENMVHYGTYTHPVLGMKQGYWVGDVFIPADKIEIYMRGNVAPLSSDEFLQLEEALRKVNGRESKLVGDDAKLLKLQHNYERSQDMSVVLEKIGIPNTKDNNDKIATAMLESFQNMDQKTLKSKAILYGDNAPITIECWWYKDPDGSYRLSTVILGKK